MKVPVLNRILLTALAVVNFVLSCGAQDGAAVYREHCALCHESGSDRVPARSSLKQMPPESIVKVLETGAMRGIAGVGSLTPGQRDAIAEFLTGRAPHKADNAQPSVGLCVSPAKSFSIDPNRSQWNGWGLDGNRRFQSAAMAGISAANVPRLKVKWALGFDGDIMAFSQPTIVGGRVFVGSEQGKVFSLDADSGCINWTYQAEAAVRTAITVGGLPDPSKYAAYFGDQRGGVYAVDVVTGHLLWKVKADIHPLARITGAPQLWGGRLYVPVASGEENASADPHYECCGFRGSVVALNPETGAQIWQGYVITDSPRPTRKSSVGTQLWGPSGAGIWSAPTVDAGRKALYVGTGNDYSEPTTPNSDAIVALNMDTGKILWSQQFTVHDAYNGSCNMTLENCPDNPGQDFDFGASPVLVSLPGHHRVLVVGQKSGMVYGLDPDHGGKVLWQVRVGVGGAMGGVQWGLAADDANAYVAVSDVARTEEVKIINGQRLRKRIFEPDKGGGLLALRLSTGEKVWHTPAPKSGCQSRANCSPAQPAAVSAIPGVVFSGALDGHLRGYSTSDGRILWDFDTVRDYTTVNGVAAHGGALNGPGPTVANGMLYVNSGYGRADGMPGNVLVAFSVDGK
jgi:polyvinyl alcohol dehydrogenase (cytochrome)